MALGAVLAFIGVRKQWYVACFGPSECFANDEQGPNLPGNWVLDRIGSHCKFW